MKNKISQELVKIFKTKIKFDSLYLHEPDLNKGDANYLKDCIESCSDYYISLLSGTTTFYSNILELQGYHKHLQGRGTNHGPEVAYLKGLQI